MSTVREIIYKIKEKHSSFNVTDDYPITDELIYSFMNDVRESLIREEFNNTRKINKQYYQMICCNEIECYEDVCIYDGVEIKMEIDTFKVKLPQLVTNVGDLDLSYVGDKSGGNPFFRFEFGQFASLESRMFTKNTHAYSIIGNELLLKNLYTDGQKFVCLLALLRDPSTACNWDEENSYPLPSENKLIKLVVYALQGNTKASDVLNNASDDLIQPKVNQQALAEQQQMLKQSDINKQTQNGNN